MATKVKGLQSLQAKLKNLPVQTRSAIKQALAESADEMVAMMKSLAPVGPPSGQQRKKGAKAGALRDSITQTWGDGSAPKYAAFQKRKGKKASPVSGDPDLSVRISAGNSKVRYAHMVEFGTAPHTIRGRKIGLLKRRAMGVDGRLGTKVEHPGTAAQPFFFPAYRALRKRVKSRISRATNRAAKAAAASKGE